MMKSPIILSFLLFVVACVDPNSLQNSVVFSPEQDIDRPSGVVTPDDIETDAMGVHVIRNHAGGRILIVENERRELLNWGGVVRIEGYCNSACTILTTLPNACVMPRARIGFHSSNINFGPVGNKQIARYLRGDVKAKFLAEWQYVPHSDIHHIWGETLVELDPQTRLCTS